MLYFLSQNINMACNSLLYIPLSRPYKTGCYNLAE